MATIACAGCGLPRAESEADKPCPVCEAGVNDLPAGPSRTSREFPTDGMPADISQLAHAKGEPLGGHRPELIAGLIGLLAGVALAVLVQSLLSSPKPDPVTESASPPPTPAVVSSTFSDPPVFAKAITENPPEPLPTLPKPGELAGAKEATEVSVHNLAPLPREVPDVPLHAGERPHMVLDVDLPDAVLSFPESSNYKPGMRCVIRGRLRVLIISGLEAGSVVDASGLMADKVSLYRVDQSIVKVNASSEVVFTSPVVNGSEVFVTVPKGEILFKTSNDSKAPRFEGGSRLTAVAQRVVFSGAVVGDGNRMLITLGNGGQLKIPKLNGASIIEYRKSNPGDGPPHIDLGETDSKAVVRRVE